MCGVEIKGCNCITEGVSFARKKVSVINIEAKEIPVIYLEADIYNDLISKLNKTSQNEQTSCTNTE